MARAVRIEGPPARRVGAVVGRVRNRGRQRPHPRKEQLRIAHRRLYLDGRESESLKIARVTEIAEHEHRAERGEEESEESPTVDGQALEEADPGRRGQTGVAAPSAGLVPGHEERRVLDREEEHPDLHPLSAGQRREVSIDRMRQLRLGTRERHRAASREQHLGHGLDEGGLAAMEDRETGRRGRVAGERTPMDGHGETRSEQDEKKTREHCATIPAERGVRPRPEHRC